MSIKEHTFSWQAFIRSYAAAKALPVKADVLIRAGLKITLNSMNAIYASNFSVDNSSSDSQIVIKYDAMSPTQGFASGLTTTVSLPTTSDAMVAAIKADLVVFAFNAYGQTISPAYAVLSGFGGDETARSFSNPSLAVNTSRQPSVTRDTMVNASVDITSTISLTTGQTGKVSLQYADNSAFNVNVVNVQSATNGNTGALTIGLNLSQVYTAALTGIVPAGKYYRLVTTNVTGTPTYGTPVIQEVLL